MQKFIEDRSLRDMLSVFKDRKEAGILLAQRLLGYKGTGGLILGILSGGVPVAAAVAEALVLPLDLVIVRKVQIPYDTEAGFGAVGPEGKAILNQEILNGLDLAKEEIHQQIQTAMDKITN